MHPEVIVGWRNDLPVAFHHHADAFARSQMATHPRASYSTRVPNPRRRHQILKEVYPNQMHGIANNSKEKGVQDIQAREDSFQRNLVVLGSQSRGNGLLAR